MTCALLTYVDTRDKSLRWDEVSCLTLPTMVSYANKCGAHFLLPSENTPQHAKYSNRAAINLYRFDLIHQALETYDRVLWVDADVLIRPDSPSLFDMVPEGYFAAHENNEVNYVLNDQAVRDDYYWHLRMTQICNENGWEVPDTKGCIIDSGVMLVDRSHTDIFGPLWAVMPENVHASCEEMLAVNIRLFQQHYNYKLYYLPQCFNMVVKRGYKHPERSNFFLHYAGYDAFSRLDLMSKHLAVWREK